MPETPGGHRTRSWWGWGYEDEAFDRTARLGLARALADRWGVDQLLVTEPPDLSTVAMRPPRITPPPALASWCSTEGPDRASHTYGKAFRDVVRALAGDLGHPPDLVATPPHEPALVDLLDWCSGAGVAAVPFGGGSSVVGGVEGGADEDGYAGVVSVDLSGLDRVLEIDHVSRAAHIEAGIFGPAVESALRPHGLTLRHFPQSFEFSTLGGWLATRSGGHYATGLTHIDDMVESLRVVTPAGTLESRRLPGSGAGPSPDRLFLGSEGALGVITRAWMRLQERPRFRASAAVHFEAFAAGVAATRALAQSGLAPTNCRLLDRAEAGLSAGTDGAHHVLIVGFESADHPVDGALARALELCRDHGGTVPASVRTSGGSTAGSGGSVGGATDAGPSSGGGDGDAVGTWRNAFIRAPYLRDALVTVGAVVETFETACTWDAFEALHASVTESVTRALLQVCGAGHVTCRFTHVYPDGPAPYFSVLAPGRPGSQVAQWDEIKAAAAEALLAAGGTITHHHAVGRVHRPWYDRQRPDLFGAALEGAKARLDPAGICNPGVLVGPPPAA